MRVLLVCESHYGSKEHERPTVTAEIIKALALRQVHPQATGKLRKHAHFAKIRTAVSKAKPGGASLGRQAFWDTVAYYNYLQEFVSASRKAPPRDAWERSRTAFSQVVEVLAPELIVCFSIRNGEQICKLSTGIPVAVVNHPSSRFAYSTVVPVIAKQIEVALSRVDHASAFITSPFYEAWRGATMSALPTPGSHLSGLNANELRQARQAAMKVVDELHSRPHRCSAT
ncbi:hypothetical protein [Pseudomonas sp. NPDC089401]|uniref:hypothetical protein n=1 Tax=Pseudomonas sp. NPDC089401 TaxID=3364462 RepID=UPI00382729B1